MFFLLFDIMGLTLAKIWAFGQNKNQKYGTLHEFACHPCAGSHANLLCIVPILVYVLPKQVQKVRQKLAFYFSVSTYSDDVVRIKT